MDLKNYHTYRRFIKMKIGEIFFPIFFSEIGKWKISKLFQKNEIQRNDFSDFPAKSEN